MTYEEILTELHTIYNKLLVNNAGPAQIEALEDTIDIVEKAVKVEQNKNKVVWVDNSEPETKHGSWPFTFTTPAREATIWRGYDSENGRERHWIMAGTVGYNVRRVNDELRDINFMTIEQAKAYCEKHARRSI